MTRRQRFGRTPPIAVDFRVDFQAPVKAQLLQSAAIMESQVDAVIRSSRELDNVERKWLQAVSAIAVRYRRWAQQLQERGF